MELANLDPALVQDFLAWQEQNASLLPAGDKEAHELLAVLAALGAPASVNLNKTITLRVVVGGKSFRSARTTWRDIAKASLPEYKQKLLADALASTDYENAALSMPMDVDLPLPELGYLDFGGEMDLDTPLSPTNFAPQSRTKRTKTPPSRPTHTRARRDSMERDAEGEDVDDGYSEDYYSGRSISARIKAARVTENDSDGMDIDTPSRSNKRHSDGDSEDSDSVSSSEEVLTRRPRTARQVALAKPKKKRDPMFPSHSPGGPLSSRGLKLSEKEAKKREYANRRRAQREIEKMEEEKNQVVAQLLNKTDDNSEGEEYSPSLKYTPGNFRVVHSSAGSALTFPVQHEDVVLSFLKAPPPVSREIPKCAVKGCSHTKKYEHPRLKLPVCSLQCYRLLDST